MARDPTGREQLLKLGFRLANLVVRGKECVVGKNLDAVADLVGVPRPSHVPLPADQLYKKWIKNLRAAQRYVRQVPNDQINSDATPVRRRPIRIVEYHIFSIASAFAECARNGARNLQELSDVLPPDGKFMTGDEMARYADEVIARAEEWWNGLADKSCQEEIEIDYPGITMRYSSLNKLFDRCVWHSTQHIRQIADVLEKRFDIEPDGRLTEEDLAGLPLPKRIWE